MGKVLFTRSITHEIFNIIFFAAAMPSGIMLFFKKQPKVHRLRKPSCSDYS